MKQIWPVPTSWEQISRREDRRRINIQCKKKMVIIVKGTMFSDKEEGRRTRDEFEAFMRPARWTTFRRAQMWDEGGIQLKEITEASPPTLLLALLSLFPPKLEGSTPVELDTCDVTQQHRKGFWGL